MGGGGGLGECMDKSTTAIARLEAMLKSKAETGGIAAQRDRLRRYRPGDWSFQAGGFGRKDYAAPDVSTLLVVGPMGAGKSTLINNLIRVLNPSARDYDRAHVSGDTSENATLFLKEYMLCEDASNICVFDTRGFSEVDSLEDWEMLKDWMLNGVRHGQIAQRGSDSQLEIRARHGHHKFSVRRPVNFVIFVVSALAVHGMKPEHQDGADLARLYKSPFLTFQDDKPVVVMTHGDLLTSEHRRAARVQLGEALGVSPVTQIFDIPGLGIHDPVADMTMLIMLEHSLLRADRNLAFKPSPVSCLKQVFASGLGNVDALRKSAMLAMGVAWLLAFLSFLALLSRNALLQHEEA